MTNTFQKHLETLADEIERLSHEDIGDWIEETILEIKNNYNELVLTAGGPSISLYIDCGVIRGQKGFSSNPIFLECNTTIFSDYFDNFK